MRGIRSILVVLALVALAPNSVSAAVTVRILPIGFIQNEGATVTALVRVSCDPVGRVRQPLEALLTMSQNNQRIYGEGYMTDVVCDGRTRIHRVRVDAFERRFHRGVAYVSAFVLVCNNSGSVCRQGQDTRNVRLF